jgi:hypothetical protein
MSNSDSLLRTDPVAWIGKDFPLLPFIDVKDRLARDRWTVVLFRHDCPYCIRSLPKYIDVGRDTGRGGTAQRIALVELPPYGSIGDAALNPPPSIIFGKLLGDIRLSAIPDLGVPIEFTLESGRVVDVLKGGR